MVKTLTALRHMCVKEFGVEFIYEKTFRDIASGFVYPPYRQVIVKFRSLGERVFKPFS